MKLHRFGLAVLLSILALPVFVEAQVPSHLWSRRLGGTGSDYGYCVAFDAGGNVLLTGYCSGSTVNLGGGDLEAGESPNIFVAKYDAWGAHVWSRVITGGHSYGFAVAADDSGNVFMAGDYIGTINAGGEDLVGAGDYDIVVAKYSAGGIHRWSRRFGSSDVDLCFGMAVTGTGDIFLTGSFSGSVDFGGVTLASAGVGDGYLARYNSHGALQWARRFGGTSADAGYCAVNDSSGNVLITGFFRPTVDFGGGGLVSAGGHDVFLAKFDAAGEHVWSERFGGSTDDVGNACAVDYQDNILLTGNFRGPANFGGATLTSVNWDIFLAKYDAAGIHQWSRGFGITGGNYASDVAVDGTGNVWITGEMEESYNFGGGVLTSAAYTDVFLAEYGPDATHVWSRVFGGSLGDVPRSVAVNDDRDAVITGVFNGMSNFGGDDFAGFGNDIFLAKYGERTTAVSDEPGLDSPSLMVQPNPFNPSTILYYTLPSRGQARIDVFDVRGVRIATVVDEQASAGTHEVPWDGRDYRGCPASSGIYIARLTHSAGIRSCKLVLLK